MEGEHPDAAVVSVQPGETLGMPGRWIETLIKESAVQAARLA